VSTCLSELKKKEANRRVSFPKRENAKVILCDVTNHRLGRKALPLLQRFWWNVVASMPFSVLQKCLLLESRNNASSKKKRMYGFKKLKIFEKPFFTMYVNFVLSWYHFVLFK
jgi:hypothetical protein